MVEGSSEEITNIPDILTIAEERAGLRRIRVNDLIDIERMFEIEKSPGIKNIIEDESEIASNREELKKWIEDLNNDPMAEFYAVVATKSSDPKNFGEVEGWLRIDGSLAKKGSEERKRYQRVTGSTLPRNAPVPYEVSYIKRPGSVPDLISSALRVASYRIAAEDAEIAKRYKKTKKGELEPRRSIMAFVKTWNKKSSDALEKADFDLEKRDVSWNEDDLPDCNLYILNWNKFHKTMQKKDSLFVNRLKAVFPLRFRNSKLQPIP